MSKPAEDMGNKYKQRRLYPCEGSMLWSCIKYGHPTKDPYFIKLRQETRDAYNKKKEELREQRVGEYNSLDKAIYCFSCTDYEEFLTNKNFDISKCLKENIEKKAKEEIDEQLRREYEEEQYKLQENKYYDEMMFYNYGNPEYDDDDFEYFINENEVEYNSDSDNETTEY